MTDSASMIAAALELLDAERATLLARVERVPEDLRARQPAPGRWSVVQVLEHLARVDQGVTKLLVLRGRERPAEGSPVPSEVQLTAERIARLRDRGERIEAPPRIQPPGALGPAEALRQLAEARAALREAYLGADPLALDGQTHTHPVIGPLTLRGWIEFVAHHEARHAEQVEEIASTLATHDRS